MKRGHSLKNGVGNMAKRITTRFNDEEEAALELLKKTYKLDNDSEALKLAVHWVNHYLRNVTDMFFPPTHEVHLVRRTKTGKVDRKVW